MVWTGYGIWFQRGVSENPLITKCSNRNMEHKYFLFTKKKKKKRTATKPKIHYSRIYSHQFMSLLATVVK